MPINSFQRRRNTKFGCFGSLNFDITFHLGRMPEEHEKLLCEDTTIEYGGAAANTAYWLAKLGCAVQMFGCVGGDTLGNESLQSLRNVGVDVAPVQIVQNVSTGVVTIVSQKDSKRMIIAGGANPHFDPALVSDKQLKELSHIHCTLGVITRNELLLRRMQEQAVGCQISCDFNGKFELKHVVGIDIVFVNHSDLKRSVETSDPEAAYGHLKMGAKQMLVVTQGAAGASCVAGGRRLSVPAVICEPVDRTGGGDAFNAGFIWGLNQKKTDPTFALTCGLTLAAEVIKFKGCRPKEVDIAAITRRGVDRLKRLAR